MRIYPITGYTIISPYCILLRVPSLFHWEGRISPGFSDKIATHMDVAPTVMSIVIDKGGNETINGDNDMHGVDLSPILFEDSDQVCTQYSL